MTEPGSPARPARGLPPEEALERWSDPEAYAAMRQFWDARGEGLIPFIPSPPPSSRYQAYVSLRRPLERRFHARLREGELLASAITDDADATALRTLLDPEIFSECEIAWDSLSGPTLTGPPRFRLLEIFEPPGVPRNIRVIPDWYWATYEPAPESVQPSMRAAEAEPGFRQKADYRHVVIDGTEFSLTPTQARIVRLLHEAHLRADPWQYGPALLEAARSSSMQVYQVFRRQVDPHWSLLIESDGRGYYRLNVRA